jgi:hypothetical protein
MIKKKRNNMKKNGEKDKALNCVSSPEEPSVTYLNVSTVGVNYNS